VEKDFHGLRGILRLGGEEVAFSSALIGEPHLANILAAATVAHALGVPAETIAAGVARCARVPGRLEVITAGQPFTVLVDYAHKPDAIEKVLRSVRQLTKNRLLTVFGCGGDRDRGKRPLMGEAAGRLSDVVVLTSDNPRTEDPLRIIAEAEAGLVQAGQRKVVETEAVVTLRRGYLVLADRRAAIRAALAGAQPGDVVVIAGKGHEDYQIIGTTKHHFDDREEVCNYLRLVYGEERV
jgi:UDP-N-acetylmuramoyl-L-alanyl-D-glutamate--2,6-diaminopimelate ligase